MEFKAEVITVKCKCTSVKRVDTKAAPNGWDSVRKCFRYTGVFVPTDEQTDDIFQAADLFRNEYRIPLRDEPLRANSTLAALAAVGDDTVEKLNAWDDIVSKQFVGKETTVKTCTLSVSELTDGLFSSYKIEFNDPNIEDVEVSSRTITCLGSIESAIGRVKNQVLRACKNQQKGEGE